MRDSVNRDELAWIARRWVELGWQRGDADGVLRLYAPDFVDLGNPSGRPGTAAENVAGIRALYAAFPDFNATIGELIIDEVAGAVAIRWSATGTHRGPFFGIAPTGRPIRFAGIETLRVRDGLIRERAGEWDALGILAQLRAFTG
jgi:steroid delta-isomerase-like uncharacterized protein